MSLRFSLILLTVISVVCDTMLLPFYPQFFAIEFGVVSPEFAPRHAGFYLAATCLTVMVCLPLWARLAKRISELHIWTVTQLCSAALGFICFVTTDLVSFWIASQAMIAFKASYLLIYPFVLRLESKHTHLGIVGLFTVLMHFGGIGGAIVGGWLFEAVSPRSVFIVSLMGDLVQVLLCIWLIRVNATPVWQSINKRVEPAPRAKIPAFVWAIGIATLGVYGFAFLARPFFAEHWLNTDLSDSEFLAGLAYTIPAWVALGMLLVNRLRDRIPVPVLPHAVTFSLSLLCAAIALSLHASNNVAVIIGGRILLGVAMFQLTVLLEVMLFDRSEPERYASDFSVVHIFQNIGLISASIAAGTMVGHMDVRVPFQAAAIGFSAMLIIFSVSVLIQRFRVASSTFNSSLEG